MTTSSSIARAMWIRVYPPPSLPNRCRARRHRGYPVTVTDRMSPTAKTCEAGTRRRSCSAPSTWAPMIAMFAHTFSRPMLHG